MSKEYIAVDGVPIFVDGVPIKMNVGIDAEIRTITPTTVELIIPNLKSRPKELYVFATNEVTSSSSAKMISLYYTEENNSRVNYYYYSNKYARNYAEFSNFFTYNDSTKTLSSPDVGHASSYQWFRYNTYIVIIVY